MVIVHINAFKLIWQMSYAEVIWINIGLISKTYNHFYFCFTGNPNDRVLYPRPLKRRSASFPTPRSLERRHSLRFFGSSKRIQRCASTRSLSKNYAQTLTPADSSSSEYQSTDSSSPSNEKKNTGKFVLSLLILFWFYNSRKDITTLSII